MRFWIAFLMVMLLVSCEDDLTGLQPKRSGSVSIPPITPTPIEVATPSPSIPLLVAPENNNTCTTEEPIDDQTSHVRFQWRESNHASNYELNVEAIGTDQNFKTSQTINTNTATLVLERGLPYSWWVVSKSSSSQKTAKSDVWTFYLESHPNESHVPFPASLTSPENNAVIIAEQDIQVNFQWEGNDLDDDIVSFEFFMGPSKDELTSIESDLTVTQLDLTLETDQAYYWQIHTRDATEHVSTSEIFRLVISSNENKETESDASQTDDDSDASQTDDDSDASQTDDDSETSQTDDDSETSQTDDDSDSSDENTMTVTLEVLEDTWIIGRNGSSKSSEGFGTANTLVSSTGAADDDFRRFLLKFSLGDLQASTIKKATLHLTADRDWTRAETAFGGPTTQTVYHVLDDSWVESDLNANAEPNFDANPITTYTASSLVGNAKGVSPPIVHQYDITSVLTNDTDGIISLRITTVDTGGQRITYFSKDSQTNIPKLVLEVTQ
ncbi:MAG: hypothetical protein OXC67_01125 [Flavobacteriaceae bacterium]|nr:hypothetical protein [Flavobacteriaceae bacterium]